MSTENNREHEAPQQDERLEELPPQGVGGEQADRLTGGAGAETGDGKLLGNLLLVGLGNVGFTCIPDSVTVVARSTSPKGTQP